MLSGNETIQLAQWRNDQTLNLLSDPTNEVISDKDGFWTVTYSENHGGFSLSGLNRTIHLVAVDSLEKIIPLISPYKAFLQTVGIAATPAEVFQLSDQLGQHGVTRISGLGSMTAPEAGWHHDGRFNLLDLITLTEIESSAEVSSELYTSYKD